jgi:hypothetical protein
MKNFHRANFLSQFLIGLSVFLIFLSSNSFAADSNLIQRIEGKVLLNKKQITQGAIVKSADEITTLPNSKAVVLYEDEVYQIRENTTFILPSGVNKENTSNLVTGSVLAAFTPGKPRKMKIGGLATLSIRGTGIYARSDNEGVHYCLCYGRSTLASHDHSVDLDTASKFHKDLIVLKDGNIRTPKFTERKFDHTSQENIQLEKLLNRPSPFGGGYRDFVSIFESKKL